MDKFVTTIANMGDDYWPFAFTHPYGNGRVYYQGDFLGSPNYPWVLQLFGGGVNWAAGRI